MAVKHIFLAVLSKKPMHGYDLKNAFEHLLSDQWTLNFGQVYTTLTRLERDGLVCAEEVKQEDKPDKKIYRITEEGQRQLDLWLSQEMDWNVFQDELSFQLAAMEFIERERAARLLADYRRYLLNLIRELIMKKESLEDENSLTAWIFERNIMKAEADLKWVERYIQSKVK
jgi:DNA-binding PadR family transcriptional regulator